GAGPPRDRRRRRGARGREGAGRPVRAGGPRRRAPTGPRRPLRRGARRRRARAPAPAGGAVGPAPRRARPRWHGARERAELRALVPPRAGGAGPLRLRPPRHPRRRARPLLHPQELRAAGGVAGLRRRTAGGHRAAAGGRRAGRQRVRAGVRGGGVAGPPGPGGGRAPPGAVRLPVPLRAPPRAATTRAELTPRMTGTAEAEVVVSRRDQRDRNAAQRRAERTFRVALGAIMAVGLAIRAAFVLIRQS